MNLLKGLKAAYLAAALCFAAGAVRDLVVVSFTDQSKEFFDLLYITTLSSSVSINAVLYGTGVPSLRNKLVLLCGSLVIGVIICWQLNSGWTFCCAVILLGAFWIIGSFYAKELIAGGWIFVGRIREALTSAVVCPLWLLHVNVHAAFVLSAAAGTLFCAILSKKLVKEHPTHDEKHLGALVLRLLLTNIATLALLLWALLASRQDGYIGPVSNSTAVRVAVYVYQFLSIGGVAFLAYNHKWMRSPLVRPVIVVSSVCTVLAALAPLGFALFAVPVAAAILHYAVIFVYRHDRTVEAQAATS